MERVKANDQQAWQRLVDLYSPLVYHWCHRWQVRGADADDVVQEVFAAVAASIENFRRERAGKPGTFRAWLRGITRNKLRDFFRRRQTQPEGQGGSDAYRFFQELPEPELVDEEADAAAVSGVYHRALELIKAEFEERTWQAFYRSAVDGHATADIAADLGMSTAAVRKAKSRVLHRLKEEVGDLIE